MAYVHAWMVDGNDEDAAFFSDILRMLNRVAERGGGSLEPVAGRNAETQSSDRFAKVPTGGLEERLRDEVGVHRAQNIPTASAGRIRTSIVAVELLERMSDSSQGRPQGPVLRTYNYVQKWAIHHPSGQKVGLDSMLDGERGVDHP